MLQLLGFGIVSDSWELLIVDDQVSVFIGSDPRYLVQVIGLVIEELSRLRQTIPVMKNERKVSKEGSSLMCRQHRHCQSQTSLIACLRRQRREVAMRCSRAKCKSKRKQMWIRSLLRTYDERKLRVQLGSWCGTGQALRGQCTSAAMIAALTDEERGVSVL